MSVRECVDKCYGAVTTRPDRPPRAVIIEAVIEAANRLVTETEGLEEWMRSEQFDPDEPADVLLTARMLVADYRRQPVLAD